VYSTAGLNITTAADGAVYASQGAVSAIHSMEIANNFSNSLIKRRFHMMKKSKSEKKAAVKFLFALPAIVLGMLSVASYSFNPVNKNSIDDTRAININTPPGATSDNNDTVYTVVSKLPQYPGGDKGRMSFIAKNIKYPEEARKNDITGTVYASFIIEKDGSVSNPKIIRSIGYGCDKEVIRVIKIMPKWQPGEDETGNPVRVAYTIPVKFNLDRKEKSEKGEK
jgi:TonB family protein